MFKDIWASELRLHEVSAAKKTIGESEAVSIVTKNSVYKYFNIWCVCLYNTNKYSYTFTYRLLFTTTRDI